MSYFRNLGDDVPSLSMTMMQATPKPPFAGAIWNPPVGGKQGFWSRPVAAGGAKATVTFTESPTTLLKKECLAKGYPQRVCSQIKAGWTMKDVEKAAGDFANRTVRERRPEVLAQQCAATGMPPELIPQCVEGLLSGAPIEEIVAALQEQAQKPKSNLLLYGGLAAAGLAAFLFLRKKK